MSTKNTTILSYSHAVYSAKKKAKKDQIQDVVFDEEARREYLTGFHKRNLKKKEEKRKNAIKRERQQRLELRKQHRQELAEQAAKNVKQVESALGMLPSHDPTETESVNMNEEDEIEFENEEQLATVTVVEDFDPESLNHIRPRHTTEELDADPSQPKTAPSHSSQSRSQAKKVMKLHQSKPRKIRYETQASRKAERTKQRARRAEKAERAGVKIRRSKR